MTKIALVSSADRESGTIRAIDRLGINPVKGKDVVLKPNFNTADLPPGSTAIETLHAIIPKLRALGANSVTLAERSGPPDTHEVMEQKGVFKLAEELNFPIINLDTADYVEIIPEDSHWKNGFLFAKIYHEAECIVETCCLKTHRFGGHFTLSLKNAVGLVPRVGYDYMKELHSSLHIRKMIAEINTAFTPDLIVLDGVTAFVDGGPDIGTRKDAQITLAGTDRVAIDAVGVAILRILGTTPEVSKGPIFEQEQIARAIELGLGVSSPSKIEILTDSEKTAELAAAIHQRLEE
ncbi:MAG: DUF362 domain-containing protein [Candidatus Heimdallarchaeota archaeon]